ncbi:unnamed protein product [Nezara viridula]|uniref:Uncharacterized protein n=1 Tax=Nezara viridula TaxID=85310 RepID=A0A9P0E0F0_NEZVI|nr:unnamed protein product [Nezara viridula]
MQPYQRIPIALKKKVEAKEELLDADIIEPAEEFQEAVMEEAVHNGAVRTGVTATKGLGIIQFAHCSATYSCE